jgi:hypothetical protein
MKKPLIDLPEDELRDLLATIATHVQPSYNDVLGELNRRAAVRQARAQTWTNWVVAAVAVLALLLSLLRLA